MSNVDRPSDMELYEKFLHGDTGAYDRLMISYGDALTLYLFGCLHDWQDAEDLMIEAFARIMAKRPTIREGNFKAYLFKTGRNLAIRFASKRARIIQLSFDECNDIAGNELIEEKILSGEQQRALYACLDRIEPELREALWLVYMEGMRYAEAAEVMKVSTKKVDHLLSRGKKRMKAELIKEGITGA